MASHVLAHPEISPTSDNLRTQHNNLSFEVIQELITNIISPNSDWIH